MDDEGKTEVEFVRELEEMRRRIAELEDFEAEHIQAEEKLRNRSHDLGERVKELNCLYGISKLVEKPGISLEEILQGTADLIPSSLQYPEIACARILTDTEEFLSPNFRLSQWSQRAEITVDGNPYGAVEVYYTLPRPESDEEPFLKEERILITAIAERLGRIIERNNATKELRWKAAVDAALSESFRVLISPDSLIEDMANTILNQALILTKSPHGYVSSVDPVTGDNVGHTLTEMLKGQCTVSKEERRIAFPRSEDGAYGALWGHSLNTHEPFYANSPQTHPASKGLPQGHIPLERFLSVPVMLGEELVGQIALANKAEDYTQRDLEAICRLGDFYSLSIQRKRVEDVLRETNRKLTELEALKEDLVDMIVHDMKNPVTNTMLALDMVGFESEAELTGQQKSHIDIAKRNQFKLSEMISNLLEISRLESGGFKAEKRSLDLGNLFERVIDRYKLLLEIEEQVVRVCSDIESDSIVCNEHLLERILSNLVANAIQHSHTKGEIVIRVGAAVEEHGIWISVEDSGEGIPKEYHEKIFEKFSQVRLRKRGHTIGTGLGLTFCKMAIVALGGTISVESEPGKGSCFTLFLPEALPTAG